MFPGELVPITGECFFSNYMKCPWVLVKGEQKKLPLMSTGFYLLQCNLQLNKISHNMNSIPCVRESDSNFFLLGSDPSATGSHYCGKFSN